MTLEQAYENAREAEKYKRERRELAVLDKAANDHVLLRIDAAYDLDEPFPSLEQRDDWRGSFLRKVRQLAQAHQQALEQGEQ